MATISQMRTGLATNLATISGLRTAATMPDNPNPPIAIVMPQGISFDTSFGRGLDTYEFVVLVIVGRVDERTAQNLLDGYCNPTGATSIKTALESDRTLGGQAQDLRVTEMRNYSSVPVGEVTYLAAEFVVSVFAT
jgi:hypothetical protein